MANGANRTILHVDDDPLILNRVQKDLKKRGYNVLSVEDPRDAMTTLTDNDVRVVILDIEMPHINGMDLLRKIKAFDGGVQVVMLTGLVSTNTILDSMRSGAETCLFKPVKNFDQLDSVLQMTFANVDRWWESLREMKTRKNEEKEFLSLAR